MKGLFALNATAMALQMKESEALDAEKARRK